MNEIVRKGPVSIGRPGLVIQANRASAKGDAGFALSCQEIKAEVAVMEEADVPLGGLAKV